MSRGRLIWPFLADLRQIDTVAMAGDPDGAGSLVEGYDPDYKEPIKLPSTTGQGPGVTNRREGSKLLIPCQVEMPRFDMQQQAFSGNLPQAQVILVFHFADLEEMDLVDETTKEAKIRIGDRLAAIYHADETLSQDMSRIPLYATHVQPSSFGLSSLLRNLLIVTFDKRDQGSTA